MQLPIDGAGRGGVMVVVVVVVVGMRQTIVGHGEFSISRSVMHFLTIARAFKPHARVTIFRFNRKTFVPPGTT